jgi:fluoride exporter
MTNHTIPIEAPTPRQGSLTAGFLAAVFIGGTLGTLARYLLDTAQPTTSGHFPTTTLLINLSGSLAIGFLLPLTERVRGRVPLLRPFLIVGILGGWTTYSTLAVDAALLAKDGHPGLTIGYLGATVMGGLLLVVAGAAAGRLVTDHVGARP